jgi:hypothetical protein
MKTIAVVFSLAVSGIAISAWSVPASANKMNGRSGSVPRTCSTYAQACQGNFPNSVATCVSAGARCKQTGVFTNPVGKSWSGMTKE